MLSMTWSRVSSRPAATASLISSGTLLVKKPRISSRNARSSSVSSSCMVSSLFGPGSDRGYWPVHTMAPPRSPGAAPDAGSARGERAAVHVQHLTGEVPGDRRRQEEDRLGDVLDRAGPTVMGGGHQPRS